MTRGLERAGILVPIARKIGLNLCPMNLLRWAFSNDGFMPHGHCYLWNPGLVRLHLVSDALIGLSYTSIPFTLAYFVRKRRDLPFSWMFLCFGIFIISCGATHYMEIWTLWEPVYWLSGLVKAVTAASSMVTAVLLIRLIPHALALPSPSQLLAVEDRFRRLLEAAPDAMVIFDEGGGILLVNSQTEKLFGYAREELAGGKVRMLLPQGFPDAGLEARAVRKDGTGFPADIRLSPMKTEKGVWTTAAIRDVSDRKKAEEALKAYAAQLESRNRELKEFGYSVAHDLRAPARAVVSFSDLIKRKDAALTPESRGYFERIAEAGKRLSLMLDGLLSLSQLSREAPSREAVDIAALARRRLEELSAQEPERRLDAVISEAMSAEGDPRLLGILMQNLVDNAWKFTRDKEGARLEVGFERRDGTTRYFVRDNGRGFEPSLASNLFKPFARLPNAAGVPGVGIGMASAARIVEAHGGRIWAESRPGEGATFYFTLSGPP